MLLLTREEHAEISQAIRTAEQSTSGEIYCVVAEESSDYGETPLAIGALAALVLPAILLLAGVSPAALAGWRASHLAAAEADLVSYAALLVAAQALIFTLAALTASIPAVRRALTPAPLKRDRVRRRALEQFLAKNMHRTAGRTGVLIFVSFGEHMAELIADEGVAKHVDAGTWEAPMKALVEAMRKRAPKQGLIAAVEQCGAILAKHVPAGAENRNELPDAVAELPRRVSKSE
jgi:putative membrane protein